ncbi:MAG: preprotein translocase subunit YajC [Chitinispirillaceae bacterium]
MRNVLLRFLIGISPLMLFAFPLFGQDKKPVPPMGGLGGLMPMLIFMFVIIYFMMIRPEQKKSKERQKLIAGLKKGDKVLTAAGMIGMVGNVKETTVMVKIAENTVVEFAKSAVTQVMNSDGAEKDGKETK